MCVPTPAITKWYQVCEEVLSFSFVFFAFVAILKKIRYILAKFQETAKMQRVFFKIAMKAKNTKLKDKTSS